MQMSWGILIAFCLYLLVMLGIGVYFYRKTTGVSDYILGGRKLNSWVTALSAQASDMSGWLLMGLPGSLYAAGLGQVWVGLGLALGTYLNWRIVAMRLRTFTQAYGDSLTLPEYFENRFGDKTRILRTASSVFITIFFLVYTASGLVAGGKLFATVFHLPYIAAMSIGALVILLYTFLGGFMAVCWTDFIQGMLMLVAIVITPLVAINILGGWDNVSGNLLTQGGAGFLNLFNDAAGKPMTFIEIISQLAWALGYFGMPHILVRFMAIKSKDMIKKSRIIATSWVLISLGAACLVGLVGRALLPELLASGAGETVFMQMVIKLFPSFIAGILLCGILAAIMSTADSQLLVTASSISSDLYKGLINKKASDKKVLAVSRYAVLGVALLAFVFALDENSSVMDLVSNAWAGFGATFGPVVLLSLFWKRVTRNGAAAGMVTGGLTVIIWDMIQFGGQTLGTITGVYSLLVGFLLSLAVIVVVSLAGKAPAKEITDTFERAKKITLE
nr:sodium/proline symporter PutP [Maliibacterium massiliense]